MTLKMTYLSDLQGWWHSKVMPPLRWYWYVRDYLMTYVHFAFWCIASAIIAIAIYDHGDTISPRVEFIQPEIPCRPPGKGEELIVRRQPGDPLRLVCQYFTPLAHPVAQR